MNKKGVELTFNTIIIAAICLISLIVIIAIFTNFVGTGAVQLSDISACQNMGNGQGGCEVKSQDNMRCIYRYGGCGFGKDYENQPFCCFPE